MFRQLAELPIPTQGYISNRSDVIHVTYSIRDHVQNAKRTVSKVLFKTASGLASRGISQDVPTSIIASVVSPSGQRRAILRETSGDDKKKRYVEIWKDDIAEASTEVTDSHGTFYADEYLGTLSFSPSESAILYTAEANPPSKDGSDIERFKFTQSFGEGLPTRKRAKTFLYRWRNPQSGEMLSSPSTHAITPTQPTPLPVLLGQAIFAQEEKLLATEYGFTEDARLLGVKGCFNRPSGIWELSVSEDGESAYANTKLTSLDRSCRSPRVFSNDSMYAAFWLSNAVGGAHAACSTLHCRDLNSGKDHIVVGTVWEPQEENGFPGLYLDGLPQRPFLYAGGKLYIACHSTWHSRSTVLLIDAQDGNVKELTPDDGNLFSWAVLGTDDSSRILCCRSSPTSPHEVVLLQLDEGNLNSPPVVHIIDKPTLTSDVSKALSTLKASIIPIPGRYPTETIVYSTKDHPQNSSPMITIPHGGPHATTTTAFSAGNVALALEGYTLSLPNYTGSLGFGEKFVRALLGKCGSLDVEDCITSLKHLVSLGISEEGKGKQLIQGGSHGGFLTGHLIGQYPDIFSAAVLRNPVISCGELSISDIPDWYYAEFDLPFTPTSLITPEVYQRLFLASPIAHVDKVAAKVLLLIGGSDMRVAPTQGIGYYHALKGRGKEVEMLWFEKESHPLDGVEAMRVGWEVARDWFKSV